MTTEGENKGVIVFGWGISQLLEDSFACPDEVFALFIDRLYMETVGVHKELRGMHKPTHANPTL